MYDIVIPNDLINRVLIGLINEGYTISKSAKTNGYLCISKDDNDYEIEYKTFTINKWSALRWKK
jgi:hypothetical protein